jgi:hypothetical protein
MRLPTDRDTRFPDEEPMISGFIMSDNINEVAAALNKASELIYNTPKEATGYKYKYTELSTVLDMIRKANLPNGLSLQQHPWAPSEDLLGVTSMIIHSSGQWMGSQFAVKIEEQAGNNWNQSCGSLLTYMRRYSAMSLYSFFQEGADSDGITKEEKAKRELKKKKAEDSAIEAARTPEETKAYDDLKDKLSIAAKEGNGNLAEMWDDLSTKEQLTLLETDKVWIKEIADNVNQG